MPEAVFHADDEPWMRLEHVVKDYTGYAMDHPREYQMICLATSEAMRRYPKEKFRQARRGYERLTDTIRECIARV